MMTNEIVLSLAFNRLELDIVIIRIPRVKL